MESVGSPMLEAERIVFERSSAVVAASRAIAQSIEERYGVTLHPSRTGFIPHGLADMRDLPRSRPRSLPVSGSDDERVHILFVGRLELRKGIDTLLAAARALIIQDSQLEFWIGGDDTVVIDGGQTAKESFLAAGAGSGVDLSRIHFLGRVSDAELRWLYNACDIYVSPSRFESFGLIYVEAMMFGKPSVGCRAGGAAEVLIAQENAIVCEPASADALAMSLQCLIEDLSLRHRLGSNGRQIYERCYDASIVAQQRIEFLSRFVRRPILAKDWEFSGIVQMVNISTGEIGFALAQDATVSAPSALSEVRATFWCHNWSGIAEIITSPDMRYKIDLFSDEPRFRTFVFEDCHYFQLVRPGQRGPSAFGDEVILHSLTMAAAKTKPEAK
jgi:hypothetical protein